MFHDLYYSVAINESKEKFKTIFHCFWETKNITAPLSSSNFSIKLICWVIIVFICRDKSVPISL